MGPRAEQGFWGKFAACRLSLTLSKFPTRSSERFQFIQDQYFLSPSSCVILLSRCSIAPSPSFCLYYYYLLLRYLQCPCIAINTKWTSPFQHAVILLDGGLEAFKTGRNPSIYKIDTKPRQIRDGTDHSHSTACPPPTPNYI